MGKLFSSSIVHITLAFAFAATVECRNGFLSQVLEEMRQEDPALRACPLPEKCEYWVDEGCNSDRNGPDDMEGFYQSQSDKAFVRCCDDSKEKTKCITISNCENEEDLVTYDEAAKLCSDEGSRLCTREELKNDICCKTGGQCHSSLVWTSTWAMCDTNYVTNDDEEYKCPSGFTAISNDLDGEGKMWIPPRLLIDLGGPIESACASACTEFHPIEMGVPCTGFEFGPVENEVNMAWGDYNVGDYACAVFTGTGGSIILNEAGRLNKNSKWRSCIKPYLPWEK